MEAQTQSHNFEDPTLRVSTDLLDLKAAPRVSSTQVDLTRYGLDKTPTLLVLQCPGATRSPEEEEVHSSDARAR